MRVHVYARAFDRTLKLWIAQAIFITLFLNFLQKVLIFSATTLSRFTPEIACSIDTLFPDIVLFSNFCCFVNGFNLVLLWGFSIMTFSGEYPIYPKSYRKRNFSGKLYFSISHIFLSCTVPS